jgi:PhzF family phenazine biosynthesis protein
MKIPIYQIDAFTDTLFGGNPACVVPLKNWLPNDVLLKITQENAVAETAFFTEENNSYHLRWFTPEIEMDLCGHATLATAHVLHTILNKNSHTFTFHSLSGELIVKVQNGMYTLDFPTRKPEHAVLPDVIIEAINIQPKEVWKSRDYMLVYDSEEDVVNIQVNQQLLDRINLDPGGIIVTAPGEKADFVSRFFTPQAKILEDPVTGSAHCTLIPYWSEKLNKKTLHAQQLSKRKGTLYCEYKKERVLITGAAKTYSEGHIILD